MQGELVRQTVNALSEDVQAYRQLISKLYQVQVLRVRITNRMGSPNKKKANKSPRRAFWQLKNIAVETVQ